MFNSLFNNKKSSSLDNQLNTGLIKENPIQMYSIASSYVFLDALCSASEELSYQRIGTTNSSNFPNLIDVYNFTINDEFFCTIFIYAYHNENIFLIPEPFKKLYTNINEDIFVLDNNGRYRYLRAITELIVNKSLMSSQQEMVLKNLMSDLGYESELENLILDDFKSKQSNFPELTKIDFINNFSRHFHNKKIVPYTPDFIQARNEKLIFAYESIVETINRIQAWLDNELVRRRIEINTIKSENNNLLGFSEINKCITPFCFVCLRCDVFGRFNLVYGIDSRILNLVSDNMASTLLRRIYEFTQGEMEPFVSFVSLSMDCITHFENSLKDVENENYRLVEVKRNEEKSISDMFNNLLRDDIDEETKKWLNR